jgi:hypothetical protein
MSAPEVTSAIWYELEKEGDAILPRPHPYEFAFHLDILLKSISFHNFLVTTVYGIATCCRKPYTTSSSSLRPQLSAWSTPQLIMSKEGGTMRVFWFTHQEKNVRKAYCLPAGVGRMMLSVALGLVLASQTRADFIAYTTTSTAGNVDWQSSVGLDFNVLSPIYLTQLGTFDSKLDGFGPATTITVRVWSRDTHGTATTDDDTGIRVLASQIFTHAAPGTLTGSYRFKPLSTPLLLSPGSYSIVAQGYSITDMLLSASLLNTNPIVSDTGGGLIQFVGSGRIDWRMPTPAGFPLLTGAGAHLSNTSPDMFGAGDFQFTDPPPDTAPEPASIGLLGLGLVSLVGVAWRRRRRQRNTLVVG